MNAGTTKALLTARFFNSACTVAEMANSSPKRPPIPEIVDRVLDLPSTRRGAYLDEVCAGDDSLRRHVEALIADSEGTPPSDFLEPPDRDALQKMITNFLAVFWRNPGRT